MTRVVTAADLDALVAWHVIDGGRQRMRGARRLRKLLLQRALRGRSTELPLTEDTEERDAGGRDQQRPGAECEHSPADTKSQAILPRRHGRPGRPP